MAKYTTIYNDPYNRAKITLPFAYWDGAFSDEELNAVIEYCDSFGVEQSTLTGTTDIEEVKKYRESKIKFHQRNQDNGWIFDKLNFIIQSINEMYYGFDLNGYNVFQYTTYDAEDEGRYDWHMDMAMGHEQPGVAEIRKLSLTLLLDDDFEGGEFQINGSNAHEPIIVPLQKGRAILFPSFMIHRVTPVTKGKRRSIVVWVVGPKFQ